MWSDHGGEGQRTRLVRAGAAVDMRGLDSRRDNTPARLTSATGAAGTPSSSS